MNLQSKIINVSHLAKLYGMKPNQFLNKLRGYPGNRHKPFTPGELTKIENLVNNDLFGNENIPLENTEI